MYDAIVVGGRCAGSATAMLLARQGLRVLIVDKASFPSDTLSTHYIHQPGVARLARWGLLDAVAASGCPPMERQVFDVGPFALVAAPPPYEGVTTSFAPRRFVLDKILLDAAIAAGVEVRERFSVKELLRDETGRVVGVGGRVEGGPAVEERASIVIGADGMRSIVARLVDAPVYEERPAYSCAYYTYFSGAPVETVELYPRPGRCVIVAPTNDDLTLAINYWPTAEFERVRADIETEFTDALDMIPSVGERMRAGTRVEKFRGTPDLDGFLRRPFGPGWALVGDAGYHKNPITAEGITDAFCDAELLAGAVAAGLAGRAPLDGALASYERARNERVMPIYALTADLAKLEPPAPDMQALMGAVRDNPEQASRFIGTIAGTVPIPEFFSPQNMGAIMGAAPAPA